jgi:galactose-1-phosphate uridylyltransferase
LDSQLSKAQCKRGSLINKPSISLYYANLPNKEIDNIIRNGLNIDFKRILKTDGVIKKARKKSLDFEK